MGKKAAASASLREQVAGATSGAWGLELSACQRILCLLKVNRGNLKELSEDTYLPHVNKDQN